MAKFRKKPVEVEAEQYDGSLVHHLMARGVCRWTYAGGWDCPREPHVHTIHGPGQPVRVEAGDWILPEPDGVHFYPCKPDIFAASYDPVE